MTGETPLATASRVATIEFMGTPDLNPGVAVADKRASEEMERFRTALPQLLADVTLRGRWVVFKDGKVLRDFADHVAAHHWGVDNLGYLSGFVVCPVEPERVYRMGGVAARLVTNER